MTSNVRYGDGLDDNALISMVVDQLTLLDRAGRTHDQVLDAWLASLNDGSSLTQRERAAVLTRYIATGL